MTIGRRELMAMGIGAASVGAVAFAADQATTPAWPPVERVPLWPGRPPGSPAVLPVPHPEITGRPGEYRNILMRGTAMPDLGVFRPARPDGRAVLILPGGGYAFTSLRGEGTDVAEALTAHGITCFVLSYRLPGDGWLDRANTPLADAQRAMRLIRAGANGFWIDASKLGVIGFSAGGHLAGSLVTQARTPVCAPVDAADRLSAAPAFGGLIYAVSNMDKGRSHGGSRDQLLGPAPDPAMVERYDTERHLAGAPPLFLMHCEDDDTVPVVNTLDTLTAARAAGIDVEAHLFRKGGHGFGVRVARSNPASLWPELFDKWMGEVLRPR